MEFQRVSKTEKTLLYNLLQKYLYEMTRFYDDEVDADGNYIYGHFEDYFLDSTRRAYLIKKGGGTAGFAMLNRHSELGKAVNWLWRNFVFCPNTAGNTWA